MTPPVTELPDEQVSSLATRVVALVDPGADIEDEDRSREWEVVSIRRSAGGQQADTAQLFRRLDRAGRMRNRAITELEIADVEIWTLDDEGELDVPLFWGQMDTRPMLLGGGESEMAMASVRPFHFGDPLRGMQVWNKQESDVLTIEHDAEFNPTVDGKVIDNMMRRQAVENFPEYPLWFLPESTRTVTAYEQHGSLVSPYPWFLKDAVATLSGWLNGSQTFIDNPTFEDDGALADSPDLKNVRLKKGQYLPAMLDALLPPYGYGWFLDHRSVSGRIVPRIVVYQRGKGTERKVFLPAIDEHATLKHRADRIDLTVDLWNLANQVRCDGSVKEYEVRITLYRAWSEADDSTALAAMTKSENGTAAHGPIWRKWVGNEAGDYCGSRTVVGAIPSTPPDFDSVFGAGNWVVRRRRLENCLAWSDAEKTRRMPVRVQYSVDGGSSYQDVPPNWGVRVLEDEIGIMFTGDSPPEELVGADANAHVRVIGTIQGDQRLTHTASRQAENPQANTVEMVLDVSDQFHYRARQSSGAFASTLTEDADEVDHTSQIQAYAETIRGQRENVNLMASISTFGLGLEWQIGDVITEITGRGIKLNRLKQDEGGRFLQVVSIAHDVASLPQRTTLTITPYDI